MSTHSTLEVDIVQAYQHPSGQWRIKPGTISFAHAKDGGDWVFFLVSWPPQRSPTADGVSCSMRKDFVEVSIRELERLDEPMSLNSSLEK